MLAKMTGQAFDSLDDGMLVRACMEHVFPLIRGKEQSVKTQIYARLNAGQQALFMFSVFYDHAWRSVPEFYGWASQLLEQPDYWEGVILGLRFFGDKPMQQLIEEMREVLEAGSGLNGQTSRRTVMDLDRDPELLAAVSRLYERFQKIAPGSLKRIADYIRANPQQFVRIDAEFV